MKRVDYKAEYCTLRKLNRKKRYIHTLNTFFKNSNNIHEFNSEIMSYWYFLSVMLGNLVALVMRNK